MSKERRDAALAYLATHQVMSLATTGPDGPWAAAVFYVNQKFDLYFLSSGRSRHGRNLQAEMRVAATIHEDYVDWQSIQGIQLEGTVQQLNGRDQELALDLYAAKYPFIASAPPTIQGALARINWYRLRPERLYFIDNSLGFGHRDQILPHPD